MQRFISSVLEHLRAGKNVVVCLPRGLPFNPVDVIQREYMRNFYDKEFIMLDWSLQDQKRDVAAIIFVQLIPGAPPALAKTVKNLVEEPLFSGYIVGVKNIDTTGWANWQRLLNEYQDLCRLKTLSDRTLFLIVIEGLLVKSLSEEAITTGIEKWEGVVNFTDSYLYAASLMTDYGKNLTQLEMQIIIMTAVSVGLWDFSLIEQLIKSPVDVLFRPYDFLRSYGQKMGWDAEYFRETDTAWQYGLLNKYDGDWKEHSAALCLLGGEKGYKKVTRRIWEGQVRSILPFLEEKRLQIVDKYHRYLTVPFATNYCIINNLYDLEINHIHYQLGQLCKGARSICVRLTNIQTNLMS